MTEIWRDVPGYVGRYQVSNLGRVKSLPNERRKTEIIMKQSEFSRSRHLVVNLTSKGAFGWSQRVHYVHRMVLEAFVGPCPNDMEACHNDGNSQNNNLGNLRWDTRESNVADIRTHGTLRGENNGRAKLTDSQVLEIKKRISNGESNADISSLFGVSHYAIKSIRNNQNWTHL